MFLLSLLSLLLAGAAACSDDPPADPPREAGPPARDTAPPGDITVDPPIALSLATFNVENLFDSEDDPGHEDDLPSAGQVADKLEQLGRAIRDLDADLLALQEVENKAVLERLNTEQLGGMGYAHLRLVEGNDYRGLDVALLSRFPIKTAISHASDRFTGVDGDGTNYGFSRDCLEVNLEPASGRTLVLLINHLRAKSNTSTLEANNRRYAQANRVREILGEHLARDPQANVAVLGDMNDTPDSRTLELLTSGPPRLTDPLDAGQGDRYTYVYRGEEQQIDYILLSPGLAADLSAGSARVRYDSSFSRASDHFPVFARFTLE